MLDEVWPESLEERSHKEKNERGKKKSEIMRFTKRRGKSSCITTTNIISMVRGGKKCGFLFFRFAYIPL